MQEQPTAVIFGAGSVGRGFLGQLFSESGYQVVFVDVDDALIHALAQRGSYTLRLAGVQKTEDLTIGPVRAVDGRHLESVAGEVARASVMATAVGARALAAIAKPIAAGLLERWQSGKSTPQNIILAENLHDAPDVLRNHVLEGLPDTLRPLLRDRVGFVASVIARMSPVPTPEQRAADPTLIVAEPYKVLPVDRDAFVGQVPEVVGLHAVTPFAAYTDRKLYIHNAGHAMLGFLGYLRGHEFGYQALSDGKVYDLLSRALNESSRALMVEHAMDAVALSENVQYLLDRFANRALGDPISRLARDPMRKLAPGDRLVGAARLAQKHAIEPDGLAWGIAAGLAYDKLDDSHAVELQNIIRDDGLDRALERLCDIRPGESLALLVRDRYQTLRSDPQWRTA